MNAGFPKGESSGVGPLPSGLGSVVAEPTRDAGRQVLRLVGDLDLESSADLTQRLVAHARSTDSAIVFVDLLDVTFLDCSGLTPLLRSEMSLAADDRLLVLLSLSLPVRRLFGLLNGMHRMPLLDRALAQESAESHDTTGEVPTDRSHRLGRSAAYGDGLQAALHERRVLGQAKGLLMSLHGCNADQAESLLLLVAEHRQVNAGEVAAGLVAVAGASSGDGMTVALEVGVHAAVRAALGTRGAAAMWPRAGQ